MKIDELISIIKDDIIFVKREACYNKEEALQYLKASRKHTLSLLLYYVSFNELPKIREIKRREKRKYTKRITWVATDFDVALNKLFGNEIEVNKEYTSKITPWGLFVLDDTEYPVYTDNPGQCDYIIIDGENYSAGAYNLMPEGTFVHYIINHMYDKAIKEIKGE